LVERRDDDVVVVVVVVLHWFERVASVHDVSASIVPLLAKGASKRK
jgi:hypothetical protein